MRVRVSLDRTVIATKPSRRGSGEMFGPPWRRSTWPAPTSTTSLTSAEPARKRRPHGHRDDGLLVWSDWARGSLCRRPDHLIVGANFWLTPAPAPLLGAMSSSSAFARSSARRLLPVSCCWRHAGPGSAPGAPLGDRWRAGRPGSFRLSRNTTKGRSVSLASGAMKLAQSALAHQRAVPKSSNATRTRTGC